jgi:hypothetical protein
MVSLIGCGSGADDENNLSTGQASSQRKARDGAGDLSPQQRPKGPPEGWIKKISYSIDGTALKFSVETTKPLEENQRISYIYWKNGKKILESPKNTLPPTSYKKKDVIFVDVQLQQEGQLLEQRRSKRLVIGNSSPIINEVNIPDIDGPGIYRIFIKARDPDGDKITFSLAGDPLPGGLEIDPHSGTVTCILGENAPPENMKFTITADDGDKGLTKKAVTITFDITRPGENQERRKS